MKITATVKWKIMLFPFVLWALVNPKAQKYIERRRMRKKKK